MENFLNPAPMDWQGEDNFGVKNDQHGAGNLRCYC